MTDSFEIRPPAKEEYKQIVSCFTETRGPGYYGADYYCADWLAGNFEFAAAFEREKIAGVAGLSSGLFNNEPTTVSLLTVRPSYSGKGLAGCLVSHLHHVLRERGAQAVKGQVVTLHTGVQSVVERLGWIPTGFLYGARHGENALVLYTGTLSATNAGTLYTHREFEGLAGDMYDCLGIKVKLLVDGKKGKTVIEHFHDGHNRVLYINISGCGTDMVAELNELQQRYMDKASVTITLDLRDPSAVYGYESLRGAGFRFCGLDPLGQRENAVFCSGIEPVDMQLSEQAKKLKNEVDLI
jgi:GNAT superfamily N-acetyltransferase